jgi:hypothetical protein
VAAPELSQDAILAALKDGHHYASTGVDFTDLSLAGTVLSVGATPVDSIVISGAGHVAVARHDKNLTVAQFDLSQFHSDWFRITMRNAAGQMAWSNPYYKSDLGLS